MKQQIARFKKMPRFHLAAAAVIALLLIPITGLLRPSAPSASDSVNPTVVASSNSPANGAAPKITAPSAFPQITIKNFGQMDTHFYRGAQPRPEDYKALAALGIKTII